MKDIRSVPFLALVMALPLVASAQADPLVGIWKAVDDNATTSLIEVYQEQESLSARISRVRDKEGKELDPVCGSCRGELANQPIVGMRFIWGLQKHGTKWVDGKVVNLRPGLGQGVIASCELELSGKRAKIVGRWGPFSGSDQWERHAESR